MSNVLLLEDQFLIAMLFEDILNEMGHRVVGIAATCDAGMSLLRDEKPDFAVVDLHLADGPCYDLIAEAKTRNIPFVVITGAMFDPADDRLNNTKILSKPFDPDQLKAAVAELSALSAVTSSTDSAVHGAERTGRSNQ
jgi:DNA-binding response OmpR family regulator